MYIIKVNVYFKSQDGIDYIDAEYSGIVHSNLLDAEKELENAKKICSQDNMAGVPYIEEI